jgi:GNAT superfamily N-acetyltransferase
MTSQPAADRAPWRDIDADTMRRLMLHEARVHAVPGRDLRDLGDAILLHDPVEPEPFWNRLEVLRWPDDPSAFDRRLAETLVLFASIGRQPHIWASPAHDAPGDLVERLIANGFRDLGSGDMMALADPVPARQAVAGPLPPGVTLQRLSRLTGTAAEAMARPIVDVLADAFEVEDERLPGVESETIVSLGHASFTHYLLCFDGAPAAVARRATFDRASYLSSIGTAAWARGRGFGRLVTAAAVSDADAADSEWTYLGVFADNAAAIGVYDRTGFVRVGASSPDLLLV